MSLSTKVLFFCFSSLLLLPCQKTLVFRFFSINSQVILKNSRPLASNFSILLSNLLKKISIQEFYDTETTTARRKQKNKTLVDRKQLFMYRYTQQYRARCQKIWYCFPLLMHKSHFSKICVREIRRRMVSFKKILYNNV